MKGTIINKIIITIIMMTNTSTIVNKSFCQSQTSLIKSYPSHESVFSALKHCLMFQTLIFHILQMTVSMPSVI